MQPLYILILAIVVSVYSNAQTVAAEGVELYNYDTVLKGGYTISYKVDDSLQYLFLKKGNKVIIELASTSKGMLYKNLGYVVADFTDYFVLAHSYGSGNPHYIGLIKKETGKNILKSAAAWIGADDRKEFLLYSDKAVPEIKDTFTLLKIRTGQKKGFSFPSDIFDGPEVLSRIQISRLTDKQLVIKYDTAKGLKTKVYNH